MKIMTLNCGSSSVKYSFWDILPETKKKLCDGIVEKVTQVGSFIRHQMPGAKEIVQHQECPDHSKAIRLIMDTLTSPEQGVIDELSDINAVAHRVVHGGEKFRASVRIDGKVLEAIEQFSALAPLHNPPNLLGIDIMMKLGPWIPHIAVFDTAFFNTMPPSSFIYAVPYEWYEKHGIRRYGFHGSSHLYVSRRAAALLGKRASGVNLITLHIGNGVSITAIKKGSAYDHSMGFTPLEGAVMGTRCGDIDPSILVYVMEKEKLNASEVMTILNKKSGLLGISGMYVDRRDILREVDRDNFRCKLAMNIECHRLKKYLGAYIAVLGTVNAIVFTAGVGENSPIYRSKICEGLNLWEYLSTAKTRKR
jgi:acetate kinase